MKFDIEQTKKDFDKKPNKLYIKYLKTRNVICRNFIRDFKKAHYGYVLENSLDINGVPYTIKYFLGASSATSLDLIRVNQLFGIEPQDGTAFAVTLEDDYFLFKPKDKAIYFFCRDSEETIKVAMDYKTFVKKI